MKLKTLLCLILVSPYTMSQDLGTKFLECRAIKDNISRLSCYDSLALPSNDTIQTDVSKTDSIPLVAVKQETTQVEDSQSITERFSEFFGFEEKEIAKRIPDSMDVVVADVTSNGGKLVIKMSNGQVWLQIDSKPYRYRVENGQPYIQRGALGSFFFSQKGVKSRIRVKRQN